MSLLTCMCGVTKKDKTINDHVRRSVKVAHVTQKHREKAKGVRTFQAKGRIRRAKKNGRYTSAMEETERQKWPMQVERLFKGDTERSEQSGS